ncbi:unnamed protein product, partial [Acanthocheilonema viteae]
MAMISSPFYPNNPFRPELRICSAHFEGGEKKEGDIPVPDPQVGNPSVTVTGLVISLFPKLYGAGRDVVDIKMKLEFEEKAVEFKMMRCILTNYFETGKHSCKCSCLRDESDGNKKLDAPISIELPPKETKSSDRRRALQQPRSSARSAPCSNSSAASTSVKRGRSLAVTADYLASWKNRSVTD